MLWLFGPSETSQILDKIQQKFTQQADFLPITLLTSTKILDETHQKKLKEIIHKTTLDYLSIHPNIKEVNDCLDHYFLESNKIKENKEKLKESTEHILSKIDNSNIGCIRQLLIDESLSMGNFEKLVEHLYSQLVDFLSNSSELDLNELSHVIDDPM